MKLYYVILAIVALFSFFPTMSFAQNGSELIVDGVEYKSENLDELFDSKFKQKIPALNEGISHYNIKNKPRKIEAGVGGEGYIRVHVYYDPVSDENNIFNDWKDHPSILAIFIFSLNNDYGKLLNLLNQYAVKVATFTGNEKSEKDNNGTVSYSATVTINPQVLEMTKIVRLNKANGDWLQYYGYTYAKSSVYDPTFDIQLAPFVKIKVGKGEPVTVHGEVDSRRGSFILTRPIGSYGGNSDIRLLRKFFMK